MGKSPKNLDNMSGNVHNNVINLQYCSSVIFPKIQEIFPRVTKNMTPLFSSDPVFVVAVQVKDGAVGPPKFWNNSIQ